MEKKEPIIKIRNLYTSYSGHTVLKGIDLDIYPYETLVILGRSGCGKSTLLRHMIGLNKPDRGEITIKDIDIKLANDAQREKLLTRIGMLFQNGALFNSMTVGENVSLPLAEHTPQQLSTIRIITRMKLGLVGLSGFEDFMPAQLSGGMKKRVALARAIAMDPDILFCDEPSAGLDPIVAAGIDNLILKLKKALRMTIVVVTHEMESVKCIADRIALLHDGQIKFLGSYKDMIKEKDPYVRQFLQRKPDQEQRDPDEYLNELVRD